MIAQALQVHKAFQTKWVYTVEAEKHTWARYGTALQTWCAQTARKEVKMGGHNFVP